MIDNDKPIDVQVDQWIEDCYNPDSTMSTAAKLTHAYRLLSHYKQQNDAKFTSNRMMKVTIDEICKALRMATANHDYYYYADIANRIEAHGIAQPSIDALIAEIDALPLLYNDQCYSAVAIKSITDKYRGQKK